MKVAIYTAITAGRDVRKDPRSQEGIDQILFTDKPDDHVGSAWKVRPACTLFTDPRRNSRAHKILAHQYLAECDYSLWIDASIRLFASVTDLVEKYLNDADVAMFPHPTCNCIYTGAVGLANAGYDRRETLEEQMVKYRQAGYPECLGMNECGVILRRHNERTAVFNNAWWSEYCRHSCRDQVSMNYVARALGVHIVPLPGSIHSNPGIVTIESHAR